MLFKIALKNLLGARLRTVLNVLVTAFSFFPDPVYVGHVRWYAGTC